MNLMSLNDDPHIYEENVKKEPKVIFLLGAGASREAGIPTINQLTDEFVNDPISSCASFKTVNKSGELRDDVKTLVDITKQFLGKADLELIMSLLLRLEDEREKNLLETKFTDLKSLGVDKIGFIRELIQGFIRKKCEEIQSVEYFWPLEGMSKQQKINIFSLNYDGTIEIFCESKGLKYTDGFDPDWNVNRFEDKKININLFKLHGSLYWFKTKSNKTIKVPMKGLQSSNVRYLTDETISEMMIYPTLEKNKQSGVYSWLSQRFKNELNDTFTCVVMGYSFRDGDIKESIIESLSFNKRLWIIIADPQASQYKAENFSYDVEIASRVMTMDMDMIKAFTDRTLSYYLEKLNTARTKESETWENQGISQTRFDYDWAWILRNYLNINHHDRVKWIVEELSHKTFKDAGDNYPNCIEGIVGQNSLQYLLEYYNAKPDKVKIWKKIFHEFCIVLEYSFYKYSNQNKLMNANPIKEPELPWWFRDTGSEQRNQFLEFEKNLKKCIETFTQKELTIPISKLIETISFYYQSRGLINNDPGEFLRITKEKDLGIKKWSNELITLIE